MISELVELRGAVRVGNEKISFTVKRGRYFCFVCRKSEGDDQTRSEQIVPIRNTAEMERYLALDIKKQALAYSCEQLKAAVGRWLPSLEMLQGDGVDYPTSLHELAQTSDEESAYLAVRRTLRNVGTCDFLFSMRSQDNQLGDAMATRYLVGCRSDWIQLYQSRYWHLNDIYFQLLRGASRVVSSLDLIGIPLSPGQEAMLRSAAEFGLSQTLAIPAYSPSRHEIGVLFVYCGSLDRSEMERARIWKHALRAVADELMEFFARSGQVPGVDRALGERELQILRLVQAGFSGPRIAESIGLTVRSLYAIYADLNARFGTARITDSARLAAKQGLLAGSFEETTLVL